MAPDLLARSSEGIGGRRRRFWSTDDKRRMIAESLKSGASVAVAAQRYGVNAAISAFKEAIKARLPRRAW
jgi:transposase-like protein